MDSPKPNEQSGGAPGATKPSIDSLRTVEFRTTIRGYHMDDVDEYLERVAVEAEALQEQTRLSADRVKQALERITSLEQQLEQARRAQQQLQQAQHTQPTQAVASVERDEPEDDSLKRTLMLAQKFVDQTRQEAEDEARTLLSESEGRARAIVSDAEEHARVITEDAERKLREEVQRLDTVRASLSEEVDAMTRRLESERAQIRKALTEMLTWVDEKVKPATPAPSGFPRTDPPAKPYEPQTTSGSAIGSGFGMGGSSSDGGAAQPRGSDEPKPHAAPATTASAMTAPATTASARATTEISGSGGPPTERIPVSSLSDDGIDAEEVELEPLGSRDGSSIRASHDRLLPGQQREMFAPGLQSNQAGSSVTR